MVLIQNEFDTFESETLFKFESGIEFESIFEFV
jgi:hypothetical protein